MADEDNSNATNELAAATVDGAAEAGDAQDAKTALAGLGGLMQNPEILAALQGHLNSMIGKNSGYVKSLPKVVQRRVKALKKLQGDVAQVESKFYEEVHALECKYQDLYQPLFDRRREILTGGVEPEDADCEWPSDDEDQDGEEKADAEKKDAEKGVEEEAQPVGIPSFWLTVFKNIDTLAELVKDHDEPVLEHLTDIKVTYSQHDPMGFTLHFHFSENEYFTNTVLTKEYIMEATPAEDDPLSFEGPEIIKCVGCPIEWNKGKNVTVKLVKKTQKKQGPGGAQKRVITKTVKNDSFFNFFSPPVSSDKEEELVEEDEELLEADYELGHFFRDRVVPRAVLYFTGEAVEDDSDDDEVDEGEYDSDEDEDYAPDA